MSTYGIASAGPAVAFTALHISQIPNYANVDSGRGRCRISASSSIARLPNIRIGRIVRLRVVVDCKKSSDDVTSATKTFDVICTLWPDSENVLQPNEIIIDDTVIVGERMKWFQGSCKIDTVFIGKFASSIKFSSATIPKTTNPFLARLPLHLPIIAHANVFLPAIVSPTGGDVTTNIQSVHPATATMPMLTNHMTIFLPVTTPICAQSVSSSTTNESSSVAKTKVVQEILSKMVFPLINVNPALIFTSEETKSAASLAPANVITPNISPFVLYRGIMLLGPPGVGKTFAVQAVQTLCRQYYQDLITIDIVPVSIPELLSSEDPVQTLQDMLPKILSSQPKAKHSASTVSSVASTPRAPASTEQTPVSAPKTSSSFSFRSPSALNNNTLSSVNASGTNATVSPQKGFSFSASALHQPLPSSKASPMSAAKTDNVHGILSPFKSPTGASSGQHSTTSSKKTINSNVAQPKHLVFLVVDEIDALGHRFRQNDIQIALKALLCDWLDRLQNIYSQQQSDNGEFGCEYTTTSNQDQIHYAMIATSNRSEDVDLCFRRGGRLEQEMNVLLTKEDRKLLWRSYLQRLILKLANTVNKQNNGHSRSLVGTENPNLFSFFTQLQQLIPGLLSLNSSYSKKEGVLNEHEHDRDDTTILQEWQEMLDVLGETSGGYVAADIAAIVSDLERQLFPSAASSSFSSAGTASIVDFTEQEVLNAHLDGLLFSSTTHLSSAFNYTSASTNINFVSIIQSLVYKTMQRIPPSCLRGVSLTTPNLSLQDVIGHHDAKLALQRVLQFTNPRMQPVLKRFGLSEGLGGVLLYGPPGNSKTRLVAAIASSYHLPLLSLSSADVYSAYVGDAEAEVRRAFALARQAAPCILFFDELDSLVLNRAHQSGGAASSSSVEARVLSTFLNEMDGVSVTAQAAAAGILVMAATNRIDCIDAALLRKGRFYQSIYVAPPTSEDRRALMQYFGGKAKLSQTMIETLVQEKTWEGMSGADVENVCKEAAVTMFHAKMQAEQQSLTSLSLSPPASSLK